MAFRIWGLTLGGKLSLIYLGVATLLLILGGRSSELFLIIFGAPLVHIPWVFLKIFGIKEINPSVGVTLLTLLWVGNAYFWGHTIAALYRLSRSKPSE